MYSNDASSDPRVVVVIPIYKHVGLAIEALDSALKQETSFSYVIMLVNDGCPFPETDALCLTYARANPGRIRYIRKKNGGLGAARNTGIEAALQCWPSIEAIYMLDADNRILPKVLEQSFNELCKHDAGWIYPDLPSFDDTRLYSDHAGPYRVLQQLFINYCDAGSMFRREIFAAGVRYYEHLLPGLEDWDFWLQAVEAGFRGRHVATLGFRYRRRKESMLSETLRNSDELFNALRRRHPMLYRPRNVLKFEHAELPRFAILLPESEEVVLSSDPRSCERRVSMDDFRLMLVRSVSDPQRFPVPPLLVATSERCLKMLDRMGLAPGLFWNMQAALDHADACFTKVSGKAGAEICCELLPAKRGRVLRSAHVAMFHSDFLVARLQDPGFDMVSLLSAHEGTMTASELEFSITHPEAEAVINSDAAQTVAAFFHQVRTLYMDAPRGRFDAHLVPSKCTTDPVMISNAIFRGGIVFPALPQEQALQIGFVLPLCEFSGVERVVVNHARECRRAGISPHLFVLGSSCTRLLTEFQGVFETITNVPDATTLSAARVAGLLSTMNFVVNAHCSLAHPAMALLRQAGIKTLAQMHVVDRSAEGLPTGIPYEVRLYEHTYDGVLVISEQLRRWALAWGIPESKLVLARNAASFEVPQERVDEIMRQRMARDPNAKLRILFLGRLDAQKGLDRLTAIIRAGENGALPFEWRVVGKAVINPDSADLDSVKAWILPPALTAEELTAHYSWADVLLLPSRFEGVPLTILEAQRLGCVVCASEVGAVAEIVDEGRTGFLFTNGLTTESFAEKVVVRLTELQKNSAELARVSRHAAEIRRDENWAVNMRAFITFVKNAVGGGRH